jgi:hypothetical protein
MGKGKGGEGRRERKGRGRRAAMRDVISLKDRSYAAKKMVEVDGGVRWC